MTSRTVIVLRHNRLPGQLCFRQTTDTRSRYWTPKGKFRTAASSSITASCDVLTSNTLELRSLQSRPWLDSLSVYATGHPVFAWNASQCRKTAMTWASGSFTQRETLTIRPGVVVCVRVVWTTLQSGRDLFSFRSQTEVFLKWPKKIVISVRMSENIR